MNWEFIIKYLPMYERAALLTVKLGLAGVICAIIVGLICAIIQYEKVPVARQIVAVYIELSRNTPLLVQLFFIYYGLPKIGIQTDPQTCGIAGLTFLGGSYMAEAFRSGLETVAAIQTESALSLGMKCSSPELSQTGSYFWKAEKYKKMKHQMSFSNTRRQIGRRNS